MPGYKNKKRSDKNSYSKPDPKFLLNFLDTFVPFFMNTAKSFD